MKYFLVFSIFIFSCNNSDTKNDNISNSSSITSTQDIPPSIQVHQPVDSVLQEKIEDSLLKLSFVKKSNDYIDSFSHHKHGIAFMADSADNKIIVKAGYNGDERFETYYIFTIDPKTFLIQVMDQTTSNYISIEEYLKR